MKLFSYISLLFLAECYGFTLKEDITVSDSIPDTINEFIEEVRDAIPEVIAVPALSPDFTDIDFLSGQLDITNLEVVGVKEFNITLEYIFVVPRTFTFKLDYVEVNLDYFSNLVVLGSPLLTVFGEGTGKVVLRDFVIQGDLTLNLIPILNLTIESIQVDLGDINFKFTGLLNSEVFSDNLNDYLNTNVIKLFHENQLVISETTEEVLNTIIQIILNSNITLSIGYNSVDAGEGHNTLTSKDLLEDNYAEAEQDTNEETRDSNKNVETTKENSKETSRPQGKLHVSVEDYADVKNDLQSLYNSIISNMNSFFN